MEALALSNSFSFQAIFAIKDQFRISECRGLRSNRAKKLQLGSLPSYQNMNVRDALMSYEMESRLQRKPRSPEGAPSGRAGASARSRIWQKGNCQITKDLVTEDV